MKSDKDTLNTSVRAQGQRLVAMTMNEKFLDKIDAALPKIGYSDRSSFIREAILEKLHAEGIDVPIQLSLPPSRVGKGGRTRKSPLIHEGDLVSATCFLR